MRYRKRSPTGDFLFGQSSNFYIDSPLGVAQAVETRLLLWTGEWFLDTAAGTDYEHAVLGYGTAGSRDTEIRQRILDTPGVTSLVKYSSSTSQRVFTVAAEVETAYGTNASINVTIQ